MSESGKKVLLERSEIGGILVTIGTNTHDHYLQRTFLGFPQQLFALVANRMDLVLEYLARSDFSFFHQLAKVAGLKT
ncbi:MAG: hypothetical protein ACI9WL_000058 [Rubritalea sp.]